MNETLFQGLCYGLLFGCLIILFLPKKKSRHTKKNSREIKALLWAGNSGVISLRKKLYTELDGESRNHRLYQTSYIDKLKILQFQPVLITLADGQIGKTPLYYRGYKILSIDVPNRKAIVRMGREKRYAPIEIISDSQGECCLICYLPVMSKKAQSFRPRSRVIKPCPVSVNQPITNHT